jgi:hypothetical protein
MITRSRKEGDLTVRASNRNFLPKRKKRCAVTSPMFYRTDIPSPVSRLPFTVDYSGASVIDHSSQFPMTPIRSITKIWKKMSNYVRSTELWNNYNVLCREHPFYAHHVVEIFFYASKSFH